MSEFWTGISILDLFSYPDEISLIRLRSNLTDNMYR